MASMNLNTYLTGSFFRFIRVTEAAGHTILGNPITLTNSTNLINRAP